MNAVADIRAGTGLVGVTDGSIFLITDIFRRLLSHPLVLPHIGNAPAESINAYHQDGISQTCEVLAKKRAAENRPVVPPPPNDPVREACALVMSRLALEFLITHELAHIVRGHVGYIYDSVGIPYMLEFRSHGMQKPPAAFDPIVRQALEVDADRIAVVNTLRIANMAKEGNLRQKWNGIISSSQEAIYIWNFAIGWLFYLWGLEVDFDEMDKYDHPPSGLRDLEAVATAMTVMEKNWPELLADFKEAYPRSKHEIMRSVIAIGGTCTQSRWVEYGEAASDNRALQHQELVSNTWNAIRPHVNEHSFMELAP